MIGAGPGGLVTARWLQSQGFEPTIFEQGAELGGQWTGRPGRSGVWPAMYTNTSRVLTAFSDLEHEGNLTFLSNYDVLDYLNRYADMFGLRSRIRFGTRVDRVGRVGTGWQVTSDGVERALRPGGGGHRPISVPRRSLGAGSRHVHRLCWRHLDIRLPGSRTLCRQARSGGGLRRQRSGDRHGTRTARRGTCGGDTAAATLCPSEVRRGSPVRPPDLHAVRSPGERDAPARRDRPPAQGDRGGGQREPGAVRRARARSLTARRRRHAQSGISSAGGRRPNHGAAVDDIDQRTRQ